MKVSKLFHWLYASLMMLPLFAIGITCLVNVFNNTEQQETTINYKYETNEVNSFEDLKVGNAYNFKINDTYLDEFTFDSSIINDVMIPILNLNYFETGNFNSYVDDYYQPLSNKSYLNLYNNQNEQLQMLFVLNTNEDQDGATVIGFNDTIDNINFIFDIDIVMTEQFKSFVGNVDYFSKCENIPIESVETHGINRNETFYKSIEQVENSNLFNWAQESFLVVPFNYILNLFGVPQITIFSLLLSYWLSISIIWLVFDLVMYVPLLVHSWIDRGVIQ